MKSNKNKIIVVGLGYVGLANALLLSQNHHVIGLDLDHNKIALLNDKKSPLQDPDVESFLGKPDLDLIFHTFDENTSRTAIMSLLPHQQIMMRN